jgi:hypothetical protein
MLLSEGSSEKCPLYILVWIGKHEKHILIDIFFN